MRRGPLKAFIALAGGFALSFVGLGVLWAGAAWHFQALMLFPFLLLAFTLSRGGKSDREPLPLVLCGAAPIGLLIAMFRDRNDSHLMPILVLFAWLAGALAGRYLATRPGQACVAKPDFVRCVALGIPRPGRLN